MDKKDRNSIILNINENPIIKAYAHHVFVNAIIEGNVRLDEAGQALKIEIIGGEDYVWANTTHIRNDGSYFSIEENDIKGEMYEYAYRECCENDEIIIQVHSLKNGKKDAILNLVITGENFVEAITCNIGSYKCGIMNNRVLTRREKAFVVNKTIDQEQYRFIKLCRNNNILKGYISVDGDTWELVEQQELDLAGHNCKIGFIAEKLGKNELLKQYDAWMCMNYLQIKYAQKDAGAVWIDYWNFPRKRCRYENEYADAFLDVFYEEPADIVQLCGSMKAYIKWCISQGYYLAISMDEYYIEGRSSYKRKHYFHQNMIFGMDIEKGEYEILGYDQKIVRDRLTEEQLENAIEKMQGIMIRYKFNPGDVPFVFELSHFIATLKSFCSETGKDVRYANVLSEDGIFGINAYAEILNSSTGKKRLIEDNRVSYFIYEHCQLNKYRLDYLFKNGYLSVDDWNKLVAQWEDLRDKTTLLKNVVIKNHIKPKYADTIEELMRKIYEGTKMFYVELIERLE